MHVKRDLIHVKRDLIHYIREQIAGGWSGFKEQTIALSVRMCSLQCAINHTFLEAHGHFGSACCRLGAD